MLIMGYQCVTLCKMLGRTIIDGCNISIVPKSKNEEIKVVDVFGGDIMLLN